MSEKERDFYVPRQPEFQSSIAYKDIERSPWVVVEQTNTLLDLLSKGKIPNPQLAKDYFHDYTIASYLDDVEEGSHFLYERTEQASEEVDLEAREAAGHASIIFSSMPDRTKGTSIGIKYGRRVMLRAPSTKKQFLKRVRELKVTLWQVVDGGMDSHATLETYPPFLRTFNFFEVGSRLPIQSAPDQREQDKLAKDKFDELLSGIDISL